MNHVNERPVPNQHVESPNERALLLSTLTALVESLGSALPPNSEMLLHDLAKLPNSIVAIHGDLTQRRVGDPATDLLLAAAQRGDLQTRVGYETRLADGRRLRSSTVIVRGSDGAAIAAVCINSDLSVWESLHQLSGIMLGGVTSGASPGAVATPPLAADSEELFTSDVDELALHLIERTTMASGIPIELMRKQHKIEIVRELESRGFFMLKGAADKAASALRVSRFTIYNYLNEISDDTDAAETEETA